MVFKLALSAQKKWRALNGAKLLADVIDGIVFDVFPWKLDQKSGDRHRLSARIAEEEEGPAPFVLRAESLAANTWQPLLSNEVRDAVRRIEAVEALAASRRAGLID